MVVVAEVFRHGQAGQSHPHSHAGGLVHLAEHQRGLVHHAAVLHLLPQVVALAAALAHAGKDGVAAVLHGDVVDEFLNQHGFAHTGAAKQTHLAALGIGLQQIDDLNARFQNFHGRALLGKGRGLAVDRPAFRVCGHGRAAVDGVAQHIEHTAQHLTAHRHADTLTVRRHLHAPGQIFRGRQHDAAHRVVPDLLRHFHHAALAVDADRQRFPDVRQLSFLKFHVHDGARNCDNFSDIHDSLPCACCFCRFRF